MLSLYGPEWMNSTPCHSAGVGQQGSVRQCVCVCSMEHCVLAREAIPYKDLEEGRMYTPDGQFRHSSLLGTPHGNT